MTEPATFDPDTAPVLTLGGKPWPLPELLGWRELRKCRAALLELHRRVNAAIAEARRTQGEAPTRPLDQLAALDAVFGALTDDDYDRLVMGPIHAALQALHPTLKREELDALPSTDPERELAWLAVRRVSGLFVFNVGPDAEESDAAGEGPGAP